MKKKILIGVCGGVAAYKAADLVSNLIKKDFDVTVCMTKSAEDFITPLTFSALTNKKTLTSGSVDLNSKESIYEHLYPSLLVDYFIVLPATANIISKLSNGLADDPVSISALSLNPSSKKIFCPAMNNQMWENSIIQENCKKLISHGWAQIGPESGRLACGNIGMGRLAKIDMILKNL